MTTAAFKATYAEWRVIKTRATVQIVFEMPVEKADEAYQALGGMPIAAREVWCAIARLEKEVMRSGASDGPAVAVGKGTEGLTQPPPSTVLRIKTGEAERRDWNSLAYSQRAGIRCEEPIFRAFLREMCGKPDVRSADSAATAIREICEVESRGDIRKGTEAEKKWLEIESWFAAWQTKERAMA